MNVAEFIAKQRTTVQLFIGAVLLALIGIGNYFASSSFLEFSVFFILPVAFFTGMINRKAGIAVSSASAAIILWANAASPLHIVHPAIAYWNALIWLGFLIAITFIIAELKALHVRERQLSRQDSLTRISSRLAFYEFAAIEMNRAKRHGQPITLAYLDLDGFKEINDSLGHDTGDAVLVTVAQTMRVSIRQTDMAARMGGDEFALILPNTDKGGSTTVLNKLLKMLEGNMRQRGWSVTFSMGAVTFITPPGSVQEMIKRADDVMFSVKNSGKNRLQHEVSLAEAVTPPKTQ